MSLRIERERSTWFLFAVIALGLLLRLIWVEDMEWKKDEKQLYEQAHEVVYTGVLPPVGMMSGGGVVNPGLSVWVFAAIASFTATPTSMCRVVQVGNVIAILLFLAFARFRVPPMEREVWWWGIALASVNPMAVVFSRKIWAQDLLPLFAFFVILGNACRRKASGAFLWGLAGAIVGQVHMSGFFFAAGLLAFTRLHDHHNKQSFCWIPWVAGTLIGCAGVVPWAIHLLSHPQTPEQGVRYTVQFLPFLFWIVDAHGLDIAYSMHAETWAFLREPVIRGIPTCLAGLCYLFLVGVAIGSLVKMGKFLWWAFHVPRAWRQLSDRLSGITLARFYTLSILLGLGVFMTLSGVKVRLHYLICAFPFLHISLAELHLGRKGMLKGVILAQFVMTTLFLGYVNRHDGVSAGDYGRTYRALLHAGSQPPR